MMLHRIVLVVVPRQVGDVYQTFDVQLIELDEETERRHAGDVRAVLLADLVHHELALERLFRIAGRFVGTALVVGTVFAQRHHIVLAVTVVATLLLAEDVLDATMHQQIRITPDRRGEVSVVRQRQSEMAAVVRTVHRLLHGAQHQRLDEMSIVAPLDILAEFGVVLGLDLPAGRTELEIQIIEEATQLFQFVIIRLLVDAVEIRQLVLGQELRCTHVRRDHAFLDDLVRLVAFQRVDPADLLLVVEHDLRLHALEVDGAATGAGLRQYFI